MFRATGIVRLGEIRMIALAKLERCMYNFPTSLKEGLDKNGRHLESFIFEPALLLSLYVVII